MSGLVNRFAPLPEHAAVADEATQTAALCAMRKSFEEQSAIHARMIEELEAAVRENTGEVRHLRLKGADMSQVAESVAQTAERIAASMNAAVARFEACVDRLATALEARA